MVTDRYGSYAWIAGSNRQVCWAHLIRDFTWISEGVGGAERIGSNLLRCSRELFDAWQRVRDGTQTRRCFADTADRIRKRVREWLKKGTVRDDAGVRSRCNGILKDEPSLWTFASREAVEPTNNAAERAIRPEVLLRQSSQGTQSFRGSLFVERMQTTSVTLRMQGRNIFEYLHDVMKASLTGQTSPSLLPIER